MSFYKVVRALALAYAKVVYRVSVHGKENEPIDGPFIVFSNHTSFADPILTACAVKHELSFLAKSDLEKVGILRWLFKKCNVVTINRGESDIAALRKSCEIVKHGGCPAIYPEGTRIPQTAPEAEKAQAGIGLMATRTKATLLPVTICYGKKHKKPLAFRKVHVYIGKPISYEEYSTVNEHPNSHDIAVYAFSKLCDDFAKYNHG